MLHRGAGRRGPRRSAREKTQKGGARARLREAPRDPARPHEALPGARAMLREAPRDFARVCEAVRVPTRPREAPASHRDAPIGWRCSCIVGRAGWSLQPRARSCWIASTTSSLRSRSRERRPASPHHGTVRSPSGEPRRWCSMRTSPGALRSPPWLRLGLKRLRSLSAWL